MLFTWLQRGAAIAGIIGAVIVTYEFFAGISPSPPHPNGKPVIAEAETTTVAGPEVSITADWNQQKDGVGILTAPDGWKVRQIVVSELSNANGGAYRTETTGNQARVFVSAHGSHKFFDQRRGWIHVKSWVTLQKM
jgi:hypothetical protein